MHYGIVAIGSRGDVQPYVALALGLMDRGHETTIIAHENFKEFVEEYGIGFVPVKGHVENMLRSPEGMAVVRDGSLSAFTRYLQKVNKITADSLIQDAMEAFEKADLIVASLLAMPWVDAIAEKLGKKWAIVQLNLPTIKTRAFPLVFLDFFNYRTYNVFTYQIFEWVYWKVNKKNINEFRRVLGLPALRISILKKIAEEKILNLHCFSQALLARPDDWSPQNRIMGFLFIPDDKRKRIPNEERVTNFQDKKSVPEKERVKSIQDKESVPEIERVKRVQDKESVPEKERVKSVLDKESVPEKEQVTSVLDKDSVPENVYADFIHWLESGDKPIYIGFGSIPIPDAELFASIITDLLQTTTERFIYCQGWSLPTTLPDHPRLFKVKSVDHQWLFPRCKAAIIHGGIGTTAAGLKAKIPLIIISIIADQPWWGKIIERKGLGVHIPFKKLTSSKLVLAMEKISDPVLQQRVIQIGENIDKEEGLMRTMEALELIIDN